MTEFGDRLLTDVPRRNRMMRFKPATMILVPLAAILFQVYLPRFLQFFGYLELPWLVTVYFALKKRQPIPGLLFGAAIGLAQDSLSRQPIGMFGIVKTFVGYLASASGMRLDVDSPLIQFLLSLLFFVFHEFLFWVLSRALLSQQIDFAVQQTLLYAVLNAAVALPLFLILDKMRE
ncbi:MAG TPA: rod shape-determining protein MreD [Bryobacteraceae bacterium]|nr:rod shape-determining protein MreD [Bryobacteraceae bacterium]